MMDHHCGLIAESMYEQPTVTCDPPHSDIFPSLFPELDNCFESGVWNDPDDEHLLLFSDFSTTDEEFLESLPRPSHLNPPSSPTLNVSLGINAPNRLNVSRYNASLTKVKPSSPRQSNSTLHKRFRCKTCDYVTDKKYHLTQHQKTHQGPGEREKPFRCKTCDYATDRKGNLTIHQKTHLGPGERDKPFRCEHCDYATDQKSKLTRHQKTHQGPGERDKRFHCEHCDYATDLKNTLTSHLRTHQGPGERVKPFRCETCDYATDHKSSLAVHQTAIMPPIARAA